MTPTILPDKQDEDNDEQLAKKSKKRYVHHPEDSLILKGRNAHYFWVKSKGSGII